MNDLHMYATAFHYCQCCGRTPLGQHLTVCSCSIFLAREFEQRTPRILAWSHFFCGAFYRASVRIVDADPFSPPGGWEPTRRLRMANARRAGNWKRDIFRVYIRTCETCAKRVKNTDLPYAAQIRRIVRACGGVCVQIARTHKHRVIESTSILFVRSTQRRGAATERHGDVGQNDKTEF